MGLPLTLLPQQAKSLCQHVDGQALRLAATRTDALLRLVRTLEGYGTAVSSLVAEQGADGQPSYVSTTALWAWVGAMQAQLAKVSSAAGGGVPLHRLSGFSASEKGESGVAERDGKEGGRKVWRKATGEELEKILGRRKELLRNVEEAEEVWRKEKERTEEREREQEKMREREREAADEVMRLLRGGMGKKAGERGRDTEASNPPGAVWQKEREGMKGRRKEKK